MKEIILVPLDGSKIGEAALHNIEEHIAKLSPELQVEVTLLGVITSLTHWVVVGEASAPVSYSEEELKMIRQRVLDYLDSAGEVLRSKGVNVHTRVSAGNAAEEILRAANEVNANLIGMSTHGRTGLRRLAFGSITDKVLREAKVPVLTVRAPEGVANV